MKIKDVAFVAYPSDDIAGAVCKMASFADPEATTITVHAPKRSA